MGFIVKGHNGDTALELVSDGDGGVDLMFEDTMILSILEDGRLVLHDCIPQGQIGNLQLTDLEEAWGDITGRPAVFCGDVELLSTYQIEAVTPKPKKAKKASF